MGAGNSWSGRVTITPPLTWAECRVSPAVEDVRLDIHEEDGPDGKAGVRFSVLFRVRQGRMPGPADLGAIETWLAASGHPDSNEKEQ